MTIDVTLAQRLETIGALNAADYVHTLKRLEPTAQAEVFKVGEGWGVLMGPMYPVNWIHAAEFGLLGEVEMLEAEVRFARHDMPTCLTFCPLASSQSLKLLSARGYKAASFMNVYMQPSQPVQVQPLDGIEIRLVAGLEEWLEASRNAWGESSLGDLFQRVALERLEAQSFVAIADGKPVAVAAMRMREGVAMLNGTGTMPQYRRRGIQRALVQTRLAIAHAAGCEWAAVTAIPGGQSARNLERLGFKLAYTRVSLERSLPVG